ncbi:hypothetical protein HY496_01340 [Candidatus Woesearchaeota archaeon]|nr:hypothetical protein [Candidatus Woesearchaeota archaeon]
MTQKELKKTIIITTLFAVFLLVVGCVNYKQTTKGELSEKDILSEIAKVEQEVSGKAPEANLAAVESTNTTKEETTNVSANLSTTTLETNTEKPADTPVVETKPEEPVKEVLNPETSPETEVVTVKENDRIRLVTQLRDPDNDTINYTFSKPLDDRGEWKTNYGDAGEYVSTLTVSDGQLTTAKKVKIVVERVNVPPVIEIVHDITVNEGESVAFTPTVKDPNNDKVTIDVSDPLKSGTFKTDHTSAGEYSIKVSATDGELSAEKNFKLTVKDVNVPPEITGLQDLSVKEGDLVTLSPVVTDLDKEDTVKVTITDPVGDDGTWQTRFTDHGEYIIKVTADDGKTKVTKQIKLTVADVNMPPEILKVSLQK